jgi:hypothetical protein
MVWVFTIYTSGVILFLVACWPLIVQHNGSRYIGSCLIWPYIIYKFIQMLVTDSVKYSKNKKDDEDNHLGI